MRSRNAFDLAAAILARPSQSGCRLAVPAARARRLAASRFPIPARPRRRRTFCAASLWLHSFGYEDAIDAFRAAQLKDPGFALGVLGRGDVLQSAALVLRRARERAGGAWRKLGPTPDGARGEGEDPTRAACIWPPSKRCSGPARSRRATKRTPDRMAALTASVSGRRRSAGVLCAGAAGDAAARRSGVAAAREGGCAWQKRVFTAQPAASGRRALRAARLRSRSACGTGTAARRARTRRSRPPSSHALHMPAHTFVQLGMWDEAAASDQASWDASIQWATRRNLPVTSRDYHSLSVAAVPMDAAGAIYERHARPSNSSSRR